MQRFLIVAGIVLLLAGVFWPWLRKLPIGRLPGDIVVERDGFRLYVPIVTMLLASALLTALLWLFRRK